MTTDADRARMKQARDIARYYANASPDIAACNKAADEIVRRIASELPPETTFVVGPEGEEEVIEIKDPVQAADHDVSVFFGRFGRQAGLDALRSALRLPPGRPPKAVSEGLRRARERLRRFMRKRGGGSGRTLGGSDRRHARDQLWLLRSDQLADPASFNLSRLSVARLIWGSKEDNPEGVSLARVQKRLSTLRRARDAAQAAAQMDFDI